MNNNYRCLLRGLLVLSVCLWSACDKPSAAPETSGSDQELDSKPEWSALQTLAFQSKGLPPVTTASTSKINGYCVAALVPLDDKQTIWILLNSKVEPYLKVIPNNKFRLTEKELKKIFQSCELNPVVASFLSQRVSK